jgi:hypothetical protein
MKNTVSEPIAITLDKPRLLLLDFNAKVAFEDATGLNGLEPKTFNPSHKVVRGMLWAALLHESPKLELAEVGLILSGLGRKRFHEVWEKLLQAWVASMPANDETEAGTEASANPTPQQLN